MRTKKSLLLIFLLFLSVSMYGADLEKLWGTWNIGDQSVRMFKKTLSIGVYERTFTGLVFEPNYRGSGNARIMYNGGYYSIDEINPSEDGFLLKINWYGWVTNQEGEKKKETIYGEVAVHFLTEDTFWVELIHGLRTHEQFPSGDFAGRDTVLWRGKKIESGVSDTNQK